MMMPIVLRMTLAIRIEYGNDDNSSNLRNISQSLIFTNVMAIIMATCEDDSDGMKSAMMTLTPGTGKSIFE